MASSNDSAQRVQSNEEVIEELTRDLEGSCVREDRPSDKKARSKDAGDSWDVVDEERDGSNDDNAQDTDQPAEDVDEVLLKDRDLLLSESELEVRPRRLRDRERKMKVPLPGYVLKADITFVI